MAELGKLDVCFAPILSLDEVVEDKHFIERKMILKVSGKGGKEIPVIGLPIKLSRTPGFYEREPDNFGESTRHVLRELGYSEDEINQFVQNKVI
jgi:formyl-CoA transferase/CoA:oxalate CoA-transferase